MKSILNYIQEKLIINKNTHRTLRELPTTGVDTSEINYAID